MINDMDPKDRDVAIVFQNSGIYRHMTVYDNMAFELKLRRVPEEQIDLYGERGGTDSESGTFAGTEAWRAVWAGRYRGCCWGRAVVRRPKVFLMDEPLANLDEKLRIQMRLDLAHIHETLGTAMLCVAGNPEEAQVADARVVVMKKEKFSGGDRPILGQLFCQFWFLDKVSAYIDAIPLNCHTLDRQIYGLFQRERGNCSELYKKEMADSCRPAVWPISVWGSIYAWSVFASSMAEYLSALHNTVITTGDLAIVYTIANSVGPDHHDLRRVV